MYNDILQSGDMPAIMRDVIITVFYKGKGPVIVIGASVLCRETNSESTKASARRCHPSKPIWVHKEVRDAGRNIGIMIPRNRCHEAAHRFGSGIYRPQKSI
jgi:hypothetical protein